MPSSTSSPQENSTFLNRFFTHNPQTIHDEIHARLNHHNSDVTKKSSPTSGGSSSSSIFQSLGFGSTAASTPTPTTSSSSSTWIQPAVPKREFETKPALHRRYAAPHQRGSYQIHQGNEQIQVDVNVSHNLSKEDLKVEVLNMPSCVVQWSTTASGGSNASSVSNSHRLRLGSSVDCQHLSANLHQGVLKMKAPLKTEPEPTTTIPIGTNKE